MAFVTPRVIGTISPKNKIKNVITQMVNMVAIISLKPNFVPRVIDIDVAMAEVVILTRVVPIKSVVSNFVGDSNNFAILFWLRLFNCFIFSFERAKRAASEQAKKADKPNSITIQLNCQIKPLSKIYYTSQTKKIKRVIKAPIKAPVATSWNE